VFPSFLNKDPSKHLAEEHGITSHKTVIFHSSFLVAVKCIMSVLTASGLLLLAAFIDANFYLKKSNSLHSETASTKSS